MIKKVINIIPWTISIVGTLVIIGWFIDSRLLIQINQSFSSMKFITALLFFLLGFQLSWFKDYIINNQVKKISLYVAILSLSTLIIVFSLFIHLNVNLFEGIIEFFVKNKMYDPWTTIPHIPSIPTLLLFTTILFAQFATILYKDNIKKILCFSYIMLFVVSGLVFLGYITNIPWLFRITLLGGGMAIHSSLLFILSGVFLLCIKRNINKVNPVL